PILLLQILCNGWFIFCFFFFQAEDGIRDRNVTGVQTCALPIFIIFTFKTYSIGPSTNCLKYFLSIIKFLPLSYLSTLHEFCFLRSEERRVGKECRFLCSTYYCIL